jgi:hypothetical protein
MTLASTRSSVKNRGLSPNTVKNRGLSPNTCQIVREKSWSVPEYMVCPRIQGVPGSGLRFRAGVVALDDSVQGSG